MFIFPEYVVARKPPDFAQKCPVLYLFSLYKQCVRIPFLKITLLHVHKFATSGFIQVIFPLVMSSPGGPSMMYV